MKKIGGAVQAAAIPGPPGRTRFTMQNASNDVLRRIPLASGSVGRGILFGLLAALIWGAWPVFSRLGVE